MAMCCEKSSTPAPKRIHAACPECHAVGRTVHNATVRHLASNGHANLVGSDDFNLCMTKDCSVAYYAPDGRKLSVGDIRIPLSHKLDEPDRLLCYCHSLRQSAVTDAMQADPAARSFAAIAEIFQLSNCNCALHHPLGGSCACSADIGRFVRQEVARIEGVSASSEQRTPLWIFDRAQGCCGPARTAELAQFLRRRCQWADVQEFDLAESSMIPSPPELVQALLSRGDAALPALVMNGRVLWSGKVPNFMEAMNSINSQRSKES